MRTEKLRLFRAMRPLDPAEVVRGQVSCGYRDENGVAADSQVETFAALRLHIDTWRWPACHSIFAPENHCRLPRTEVVVKLKCPAVAIFDDISHATAIIFVFSSVRKSSFRPVPVSSNMEQKCAVSRSS